MEADHTPADYGRRQKAKTPQARKPCRVWSFLAVPMVAGDGIDIGQAHDPSAIAVVTRITTETTNPQLRSLNPEPNPRYEVQHLERLRLGMPYPQQVDAIEAMLCRPPLNRVGPRVLVDYTGVGRPCSTCSRAATRCVARKASSLQVAATPRGMGQGGQCQRAS